MKLAYWSLFVAGLFFGGVIDHLIFAFMKSPVTPYGVHLGKAGNWYMAAFDLILTILFFMPFYKRILKS